MNAEGGQSLYRSDPTDPTDNQEIEAAELAVRGLHACAVCRMPTAPENRSVCYKCLPEKEEKVREELSRAVAELREARAAVKWWQGVAENKQAERDAESDRAASWKNLAEKYQELAEARKDALHLSKRHKDEADRLRAALELLAQIRHVSGSAQAAFRSNLKMIDAVLERGLDVRKDGALEELLG